MKKGDGRGLCDRCEADRKTSDTHGTGDLDETPCRHTRSVDTEVHGPSSRCTSYSGIRSVGGVVLWVFAVPSSGGPSSGGKSPFLGGTTPAGGDPLPCPYPDRGRMERVDRHHEDHQPSQ